MILVVVIAVTFLLMEGVAWAMHKYIMHGLFWKFHRDHHLPDEKHGAFERNDVFFIFFSILAILAFGGWSLTSGVSFLGIGIGISLYGFVYFLIHDLFIHQRLKIWRNTTNPYLLAIRRAHKMHHKHLDRLDGECFGMLWVPLKYYRREFKSRKLR